MRFNNIDEIIKMGFQESERQNEPLANLSKERVWNAIERPKKSKSVHWTYITAMAASVTLFLVSAFLIYKLDLKQKEVDAMHAEIMRGISPTKYTKDNPFSNEIASPSLDLNNEKKPLSEPSSTDRNAKPSAQDHGENFTELKNEKFNYRKLIAIPVNEAIALDFITEMVIPDVDPPKLIKPQISSAPEEDNEPSATKPRNPGKLKVRLGNGNSTQSSHHSSSLNLKL